MDLIEDIWKQRVELQADDVFVTHQAGWTTVGEFDARARAMADELESAGVEAGALVATMTTLSPDALALGMALQMRRLVQVPLLVGLTEFEVDSLLRHSRSRWLIAAADDAGALRGRVVRVIYPGHVLVDLGESTPDRDEEARLRDADAGWIVYTSGSSGAQKGVVLPRASLTECGTAFAGRYELGPSTRILMCFPMAHVLGTHAVPGIALASGGSIGLSDGFSVSRFWKDVHELGVTTAILFPSQLTLIAGAGDAYQAPFEFTITHEYSRRFAELYPQVRQATVWGMTETGAVCCGTSDDRIASEPDLIGPPMLPGVGLRICDDAGADLETGRTGEIWFRHEASQMIEYYREPEVTRETVVDGWVRTGDLGTLVDGELRFRGRLKNVIKRSGETIGGDEIERALLEHPGVRECAVAAVPDEIRTEEVGAVVVVNDDIDPRTLAEYCAQRLAEWKVPRYWVLRTADLPRLANEKIDVQRVKSLLAEPSGRSDLNRR